MSDINDVIGRAIADTDFRNALLANAAEANTEFGLNLTDEQIATIGKLDASAITASLSGGDIDLSAE